MNSQRTLVALQDLAARESRSDFIEGGHRRKTTLSVTTSSMKRAQIWKFHDCLYSSAGKPYSQIPSVAKVD
jgi:hypothetical protein